MITSLGNGRIKNLNKLMTKAKARREDGAFVVEGRKTFLEAPGELVREVYVSQEYSENCSPEVRARLEELTRAGVLVEVVSDPVFKAMSDTVTPQGILAVVSQPTYRLEELLEDPRGLLLVLEDLQDPCNLGTIMRTAEGAGVSGIILSKGTVDLFNPKVVRSTMGTIFRVPFVYEENLSDVLGKLEAAGFRSYCGHLRDSVDYCQVSYVGKTAFLIGNEGNGLSDELCERASGYVKIPMEGQVESLNASVAAALLLYEAFRQRRQ